MGRDDRPPRGGHGGSAEIIGGPGFAEGGAGGRGGAKGSGRGGDGGGVSGPGKGRAYGGDGGDAGRLARPALGAASPLAKLDASWISIPGMTDVYGIPQPGRGGESYVAHVTHEGREYCLNVLLRLIQGPIPAIVNDPSIIDAVDELELSTGIRTPQEWWDLAVENFPEESATAMAHMRACESG